MGSEPLPQPPGNRTSPMAETATSIPTGVYPAPEASKARTVPMRMSNQELLDLAGETAVGLSATERLHMNARETAKKLSFDEVWTPTVVLIKTYEKLQEPEKFTDDELNSYYYMINRHLKEAYASDHPEADKNWIRLNVRKSEILELYLKRHQLDYSIAQSANGHRPELPAVISEGMKLKKLMEQLPAPEEGKMEEEGILDRVRVRIQQDMEAKVKAEPKTTDKELKAIVNQGIAPLGSEYDLPAIEVLSESYTREEMAAQLMLYAYKDLGHAEQKDVAELVKIISEKVMEPRRAETDAEVNKDKAKYLGEVMEVLERGNTRVVVRLIAPLARDEVRRLQQQRENERPRVTQATLDELEKAKAFARSLGTHVPKGTRKILEPVKVGGVELGFLPPRVMPEGPERRKQEAVVRSEQKLILKAETRNREDERFRNTDPLVTYQNYDLLQRHVAELQQVIYKREGQRTVARNPEELAAEIRERLTNGNTTLFYISSYTEHYSQDAAGNYLPAIEIRRRDFDIDQVVTDLTNKIRQRAVNFQTGVVRQTTLDGGRFDGDEQLVYRGVFADRLRQAAEMNSGIPENPLLIFLEVADEVGLTSGEMREMAMTLRGYRTTGDSMYRYNFNNLYEHERLYNIDQPGAIAAERRRQRLILYDLAEEQVKLNGTEIMREPTGGILERPVEQNMLIYNEMRRQLDLEREVFRGRADPATMFLDREDQHQLNELTVFQNEVLLEEYNYLQDQMRRGRVINTVAYNNELNSLRRAMRARALEVPYAMPDNLQEFGVMVQAGREAMRQLDENIPAERRGLTVMDPGLYDQQLRGYLANLNRRYRERNEFAVRVAGARPLEPQDYMQMALRARAVYDTAQRDATRQFHLPGPRLDQIINVLANDYGLNNAEINTLVGVMFNEFLPEQGRFYNFENFYRQPAIDPDHFSPQDYQYFQQLIGTFGRIADQPGIEADISTESRNTRRFKEAFLASGKRKQELTTQLVRREIAQEQARLATGRVVNSETKRRRLDTFEAVANIEFPQQAPAPERTRRLTQAEKRQRIEQKRTNIAANRFSAAYGRVKNQVNRKPERSREIRRAKVERARNREAARRGR